LVLEIFLSEILNHPAQKNTPEPIVHFFSTPPPYIHRFLVKTDEYKFIFVCFSTDGYNLNIFVVFLYRSHLSAPKVRLLSCCRPPISAIFFSHRRSALPLSPLCFLPRSALSLSALLHAQAWAHMEARCAGSQGAAESQRVRRGCPQSHGRPASPYRRAPRASGASSISDS
jgi:hypothetical protein